MLKVIVVQILKINFRFLNSKFSKFIILKNIDFIALLEYMKPEFTQFNSSPHAELPYIAILLLIGFLT